jgi:UDP-N-acetylglucosamine:LPS N-acetylglucosamine transferase
MITNEQLNKIIMTMLDEVIDNSNVLEVISKAINEIINDKEKLKKMGDASKKMAVYNSEEKIYEEIKRLVG